MHWQLKILYNSVKINYLRMPWFVNNCYAQVLACVEQFTLLTQSVQVIVGFIRIGKTTKFRAKFCMCHHSRKKGKSERFDSCDRPSNLTQIGLKPSIFQPYDLEIWLMTSKNYRAPLLHYIKLCASSQTPRWIRTAVAVRKRSIRGKISLVHHFKAIREFKLKLQSRNAQFGQKWAIFCPVWP